MDISFGAKGPVFTEARRSRLQEGREALAKLQQINASAKVRKKGASAQKIERLKRELEALRKFSAVGDPKAVARQAARIARQLAEAVKEGGGGQSAPLAAVLPSPAAVAPATEDANPAEAETTAGETKAEPHAREAVRETPDQPGAQDVNGVVNGGAPSEARQLMKRIKALIEQQRRRAAGDADVDRSAREADEADAVLRRLLSSPGVDLTV